ncbi:hypothetical protein A3Q56_00182 [Intoshia linei]|uniref:Tyrosine-protein kinase ephrin type A/B receptor-like domain-containing protein n=1 Tax=Intoshia linei TaxID=1819745 RepID=A0A177BEP4_9BILA|nr:hypothetical protein A3Q56_00182 [Intoshia linei]
MIRLLLFFLIVKSIYSITPCISGKYLDTSLNCQTCPKGFYCPDGTISIIPCPVGTSNAITSQTSLTACVNCIIGKYTDTSGSTSCTTCKPGYKCENVGTFQPIICLAGTYSDGKTCKTCESGFYCPTDGLSNHIACPANQYSLTTGATTCELCPVDYKCTTTTITKCADTEYSDIGVVTCTSCTAGKIINAMGTGCYDCPGGFDCSSGTNPTPCNYGYYSATSENTCTPCTAGYHCANKITESACNVGTYSLAKAIECITCPFGFSCLNNNVIPIACATGYTSQFGQIKCFKCSVGSQCNEKRQAEECKEGYYSLLGTDLCIICPAGSYCQNNEKAVVCPAGYYSLTGKSKCTLCPDGNLCTNNNVLPVPCPSGTYNVETPTATACTDCPAGSYCKNAYSIPILCEKGYYSAVKSTSCIYCPEGYRCHVTKTKCSDGYYSEAGNMYCIPSRGGYYTDGFKEYSCAFGHYALPLSTTCTISPAGKFILNRAYLPVNCKYGTYSTVGLEECIICPAGYSCTTIAKTQCNSGEYSVAGDDKCHVCVAGSICPSKSIATITKCTLGSYALASSTSCTLCPAGSYCPSTTTAIVTACDAGQYSLGSSYYCIDCPSGYKCATKTLRPVKCSSGYYSAKKQTICIQCEAGYACLYTEDYKKKQCDKGTYSSIGSLYCTICTVGYVCESGSIVPNPTAGLCKIGHYCDGKDSFKCPIGTYNGNTGSSSIDACQACPAGTCCSTSALSTSASSPCVKGYYCPERTTNCMDFPCKEGTYSASTSLTAANECTICPAGSYCLEGSYLPRNCAKGFYCVLGSSQGKLCPEGTYGNSIQADAVSKCLNCIAGHYCPKGSRTKPIVDAIPCPTGTYNSNIGSKLLSDCLPCTSGFSCPSIGLNSLSITCEAGYYCPTGSKKSRAISCPSGTVDNTMGLKLSTECSSCPVGFYCLDSTCKSTLSGCKNVPIECPKGYYCPTSTGYAKSYPCPPGTYGLAAGYSQSSDCVTCPAGEFCLGKGETTTSGRCDPGHYCVAGSKNPNNAKCLAGTYNSDYGGKSAAECRKCLQGHYCTESSIEPIMCPEGTFMTDGVTVESSKTNPYVPLTITGNTGASKIQDCQDCPAGSICKKGANVAIACGKGMYSLAKSTICETCLEGYMCSSTTTSKTTMLTAKCTAGYLCKAGTIDISTAEIVKPGKYSLEGTNVAISCPAGTFGATEGLKSISECTMCRSGEYCTGGKQFPDGQCDKGYYCPSNIANPFSNSYGNIGSYGPKQIKCPQATYNIYYKKSKLEDCIACTSGFYCGVATVNPLICPAGHYCPISTFSPIACPVGSKGSSADCKKCDPGYFCSQPGVTNPTGKCDSGYLCISGSKIQKPIDGTTGKICPKGFYCPKGIEIALPCPVGTYSNVEGLNGITECKKCDAGYYCSSLGAVAVTNPCDAGYYCPDAAQYSKQLATDPGYYAPQGSAVQTECPIGTFTPEPSMAACVDCLAGYYCENLKMSVPVICPIGFYCPTKTIVPKECPPGTYSKFDGQISFADCISCPPGQYCSNKGASQSYGLCKAGHVCFGYALIEDPVYNIDVSGGKAVITYGDICKQGHYCLAGSSSYIPCPIGTYNPNFGGTSLTNCLSCEKGMYCPNSGMTSPAKFKISNATNVYTNVSLDKCSDGFYCTLKSFTLTPLDGTTGNICPVYNYCVSGSSSATPCEDGYYNNNKGSSACILCKNGYICLAGVKLAICPSGGYCPKSTVDYKLKVSIKCGIGYYNGLTGRSTVDDCIPCKSGKYCDATGLSAVTGDIAAGYWAYTLASSSTPTDSADGYFGRCPRGHYCPLGSGKPIQCKSGYYGKDWSQTSIASCVKCSAGYACPFKATTSTNNALPCLANFFCKAGSITTTPVDGMSGNLCGLGKMCTQATTAEISCKAGTYQDEIGKSECKVCKSGFYCPAASTNPIKCPKGYYCPNGISTYTAYKCPIGTYNPLEQQKSINSCLDCTSGYYCDTMAKITITTKCDAGYYCVAKATSKTPPETALNGKCKDTYYCPIGSKYMKECSAGKYCSGLGLATPNGSCDAGYICNGLSKVKNPTDGTKGNICPIGHFCTSGTVLPEPCPSGTFRSTTGAKLVGDCAKCPTGKYCDGIANSQSVKICKAGYFCPENSIMASLVGNVCPIGYYCPEGSSVQIICASGTYQPQVGQSSCIPCPTSNFCDNSGGAITLSDATLCPKGHICREGTSSSTQYPCQIGTYKSAVGSLDISQCEPCPGGFYCDTTGIVTPTKKCSAGTAIIIFRYYCILGAKTATPTQSLLANICKPGHYCVVGSVNPIPCPIGSFSSSFGLKTATECTDCTAGKYCETKGLLVPTGSCEKGYYCKIKASSPSETKCSAKFYCPQGTTVEIDCPIGFFCPIGTAEPITCSPGMYCEIKSLSVVTGLCDAGYYCTSGSSSKTPTGTNGNICDKGFYCLAGSYIPVACPPGTYQPNTNAKALSDCLPCTAGSYCIGSGLIEVSGTCKSGYFCKSGTVSPKPKTAFCPKGYFCKSAATDKSECPSGQYNFNTHQSSCKQCKSGYFCNNAGGSPVITISTSPCPKGYFCLMGTKTSNQSPCPLGKYNDAIMAKSSVGCKKCKDGYVCDSLGLVIPTKKCPAGSYCRFGENPLSCTAGSYCPLGSYEPIPCPVGTFSAAIGLSLLSQCTDCTAGKYCDKLGATIESGNCLAGYYCESGSKIENNKVCAPAGTFCPASSTSPQNCPAGYWSDLVGLSNVNQCKICTIGYYCDVAGLAAPKAKCPAKYFCPEGTIDYSTNECPIGYQCPTTGLIQPMRNNYPYKFSCKSGYYTDIKAQSACKICDAGYYCLTHDYKTEPIIKHLRYDCPIGYYCEAGTALNWKPCPISTFSTTSKLTLVSQCTKCKIGEYCDNLHLYKPTGSCKAGSYCVTSSSISSPNVCTLTSIGAICPTKNYCTGKDQPIPCLAGFYQDEEGSSSCKKCPAGYFCGAAISTFIGNDCPQGHYCPEGTKTATELKCPVGTFNRLKNRKILTDCLSCLPGYYCDVEALVLPIKKCSGGYYCMKSATTKDPKLENIGDICPIGYYCPEGSAVPIICPPGKYCDSVGLLLPTADCQKGHYCTIGTKISTPMDGVTGNICLEGYYCPIGKYCSSEFLTTPTGNCQAGYFCPTGASLSQQTPCTIGHYCTESSSSPRPCESRKYQDEDGSSTCKNCFAGYYCNGSINTLTNPTGILNCDKGKYCTDKSQQAVSCSSGTYNDKLNAISKDYCKNCPSGLVCDQVTTHTPTVKCPATYYCKYGANTLTPNLALASICPAGYYCPIETAVPIPCPIGTYSRNRGLKAVVECKKCIVGNYCPTIAMTDSTLKCPSGYYCPEGSSIATAQQCASGKYCASGTSIETKCAIGTFSNIVMIKSKSECLLCTSSFYCQTEALTAPTGKCSAGYYCPIGSKTDKEIDCVIGQYCPLQSAEPIKCQDGTFTSIANSDKCLECPAGSYCLTKTIILNSLSSVKISCEKGYYCLAGTGYYSLKCYPGSYSSDNGNTKASDCIPCKAGFYCDGFGLLSVKGPCKKGFYCKIGSFSETPIITAVNSCTLVSSTEDAGQCPKGHYCLLAASVPIKCAESYYTDLLGQFECQECPAKYYCVLGTVNPIICPKGHFCPKRSFDKNTNPCEAGKYSDVTGLKISTECKLCTVGKYCEGVGNVGPTGDCAEGYFCESGVFSKKPYINGGFCKVGFYCPLGSSFAFKCTAGKYCDRSVLSKVSGDCNEGYYCPIGSKSRFEKPCPIAHYCTAGSDYPTRCPAGTYSNMLRLVKLSDCLSCIAGYYCSMPGIDKPIGLCPSGYYCPTKTITFTLKCTKGHKCVEGSAAPVPCESGTYQNKLGSSKCEDCPPGYFCDATLNPVIDPYLSKCPKGYYCPLKTTSNKKYPCLIGTYNDNEIAASVNQCKQCPIGYYCPSIGMSAYSAKCTAGYYCSGGQSNPKLASNICKLGYFCLEGTLYPAPCPKGTYSITKGLTKSSECTKCIAGRYCEIGTDSICILFIISTFLFACIFNVNLRKCAAGYICLTGSYIKAPTDNVIGYACPKGNYCTEGAINPTKCAAGTYADIIGLGACKICPSGLRCPELETITPIKCEVGKYCKEGTIKNSINCPKGTFNPNVGGRSEIACKYCPSGKYCDSDGLSAPTGSCAAGYICISGSKSISPNDNVNIPCPKGNYCLAGAISGTPCPIGMILSNIGAKQASECLNCIGRHYCDKIGGFEPTDVCSAGFFCPDNELRSTARPTNHKCTKGHYCPVGSLEPLKCQKGYFQPSIQSTVCIKCPKGFFCKDLATIKPTICSAYSYCPLASVEPITCPDGTFTDATTDQLEDASQCTICPLGKYCQSGKITGDCDAGFYCVSGNKISNPEVSSYPVIGSLCPYGYWCPIGCKKPEKCMDGKVINMIGAKSINDCDFCPAGKQCPIGAVIPKPCSVGHYCEYNKNMVGCPKGTYLDFEEAKSIFQCKFCPAGYICSRKATVLYKLTECPIGNYCPIKADSIKPCVVSTFRNNTHGKSNFDCFSCSEGYYCDQVALNVPLNKCNSGKYCPTGTIIPSNCPIGYFCPKIIQKIKCPVGYYCPVSSEIPIKCPIAHYCPLGENSGAVSMIKCPLGYRYIIGSNQDSFKNTCQPCPSGYYGDETRLKCNLCPSKQVCPTATISYNISTIANSVNWALQNTSYICPIGHYCPMGSGIPTPCPIGYFNRFIGKDDVRQCLPCKSNYFTHMVGMSSCIHCGSKRTHSLITKNSCVCPPNKNLYYQTSSRSCACEIGTYLSDTAKINGYYQCKRHVYNNCDNHLIRNEYGDCVTIDWLDQHCKNEVCDSSNLFIRFDVQLGRCLCKIMERNTFCDTKCISNINNDLTLNCRNGEFVKRSYVKIGKQKVLTSCLNIPNYEYSLSEKYCSHHIDRVEPLNFVVLIDKYIIGVEHYNTDVLYKLFNQNSECSSESKFDGVISENEFSGIHNPIVCLEINEIIIFIHNDQNYPIFDRLNLFNSPTSNLDTKAFDLLENVKTNTSNTKSYNIFPYRFMQPGVFVFKHSVDHGKKIYIAVMSASSKCQSYKKFMHQTQQNFYTMKFSFNTDILVKSNLLFFILTIITIIVSFVLIIVINIIFTRFGWKKGNVSLKGRQYGKKFDLSKLASRGTKLESVDKYANCNENIDDFEIDELSEMRNVYLDLDKFNKETFYNLLNKQSAHILLKSESFDNKICTFYSNIKQNVTKLEKMVNKIKDDSQPETYTVNFYRLNKHLEMLNQEIIRRKYFAEIVTKISKQIQDYITGIYKENFLFNSNLHSTLSAIIHCCELIKINKSQNDASSSLYNSLISNVHLISNMRQYYMNRLISIINLDKKIKNFKDSDGHMTTLPIKDDIDTITYFDKLTGLDMLKEDYTLINPNNDKCYKRDAYFYSKKYCFFSKIEGNVFYDCVQKKLVNYLDNYQLLINNSNNGKNVLIPFIPMPVDVNNEEMTAFHVHQHTQNDYLSADGFIIDYENGFYVPTLAVTFCFKCKHFIALGKTFIDPITNLVHPLTVGSCLQTKSGLEVCIGLKFKSGNVCAKTLKYQSGQLENLPCAMNFILMDDNFYVLMCSKILSDYSDKNFEKIKTMEQDQIFSEESLSNLSNICENSKNFLMSLKNVETEKSNSFINKLNYWSSMYHCFSRMSKTGGCDGFYRINQDENVKIPLLIGSKYFDIENKMNNAHILGTMYDTSQDKLFPLCGLMHTIDKTEKIPIEFGKMTIDYNTLGIGKVCSVEYDYKNCHTVCKTVQSTCPPPQGLHLRGSIAIMSSNVLESIRRVEKFLPQMDPFLKSTKNVIMNMELLQEFSVKIGKVDELIDQTFHGTIFEYNVNNSYLNSYIIKNLISQKVNHLSNLENSFNKMKSIFYELKQLFERYTDSDREDHIKNIRSVYNDFIFSLSSLTQQVLIEKSFYLYLKRTISNRCNDFFYLYSYSIFNEHFKSEQFTFLSQAYVSKELDQLLNDLIVCIYNTNVKGPSGGTEKLVEINEYDNLLINQHGQTKIIKESDDIKGKIRKIEDELNQLNDDFNEKKRRELENEKNEREKIKESTIEEDEREKLLNESKTNHEKLMSNYKTNFDKNSSYLTNRIKQLEDNNPHKEEKCLESQYMNLLQNSVLYKKIENISNMINTSNPGLTALNKYKNCKSYTTLFSNFNHFDSKLKIIPASSLDCTDFIIYNFGTTIFKRLINCLNLNLNFKILLASQIPPNNYLQNCFRYCIHYQNEQNILYIRKEICANVGSFLFILTHCASHIIANNMNDDFDVTFFRVFQKILKVVCGQVFVLNDDFNNFYTDFDYEKIDKLIHYMDQSNLIKLLKTKNDIENL